MSGKDGSLPLEGGVPKNVIRVHVRVDHIADGLVCDGLYGFRKALSFPDAAPRVHDRNRILAHDEADIRNRSFVGWAHKSRGALESVDARSDLFDRERAFRRGGVSPHMRDQHEEREANERAGDVGCCLDVHLGPDAGHR